MRNYEALSKSKTGVATIRLVRHVKRDTVFQWFCIELQRICFGERMGGGGGGIRQRFGATHPSAHYEHEGEIH